MDWNGPCFWSVCTPESGLRKSLTGLCPGVLKNQHRPHWRGSFWKMYPGQRHLFCLQLLAFSPAIDFVLSYTWYYERRGYLFCSPNQAWLGGAISAVMKSVFQARSAMVRSPCPPAPSSKRHFLLSLKKSVSIHAGPESSRLKLPTVHQNPGWKFFCLQAYRLWPGVSRNRSETFSEKPWGSCAVWTNIWYETGAWWLRATLAAMLDE